MITLHMSEKLQNVLSKLPDAKEQSPNQWSARCRAHDDRTASLSISQGKDDRVLLHCHAGCSPMSIVGSIGIRLSDLMPPKQNGRDGKPASQIVATYDYVDAGGELLYQVCRFQPKDFRQRKPDGQGGWVWKMTGVHRILYHLPSILAAEPSTAILIVEGEKDADNLRKLGFVATTSPGGAGKWHLVDSTALSGKRVVIIPDNDATGRKHARDIATSIGSRASVQCLILPDTVAGKRVKDASDWIEANLRSNESLSNGCDRLARILQSLVADAPSFSDATLPDPKPDSTDSVINTAAGMPNILLGTDEYRVIEESIAALRSDDAIYQRGNMLSRVMRDAQPSDGIIRSDGSMTISTIPAANLRERLTRVASFTKKTREGDEVAAHPAPWLISGLHARGEWPGIRPLCGTSDAPILRPDGSVWQQPGYDPATGVLFEPPADSDFPEIHPQATIDDADAAMMRLLEVVCDFRFEALEHRSAWLAGLLTPLARFAFAGPSPLFLIDANVRGAGKGLLAQTIGRIVLGREMPVSSYSHDSQELRKRITACAIAGDRLLLLDNLEGVFGNDALDRALTTTLWKDRILGRSEEIELPLLATWFATGNNVQVAADTTRRIIHIRMDVLLEKPEDRSDFVHPNLLAWVSKHRASLLSDAMTILSAYCKAGKPSQSLTPFGSFEGWSDLVRSAICWLGLPDPCLTRARLAEASDTTADALSQFIAAWADYDQWSRGLILSELLTTLYPQDRAYMPIDEPSVQMRSAIENLIGCPPGKTPTNRQLGTKLRGFKRRVIQGMMLDVDQNSSSKLGARWKLFTTKS